MSQVSLFLLLGTKRPPRSMLREEAQEWAASFDPQNLPYNIIRRLTIILHFLYVAIGDLRVERWTWSLFPAMMTTGTYGVRSLGPRRHDVSRMHSGRGFHPVSPPGPRVSSTAQV